jgi:hypothetical protein
MALVGVAACSSGGPTTSGGGAVDAAAPPPPPTNDDAGPVSTQDWLGSWTCTAGGTIGGAALPNSASQATITLASPGTLSITATLAGTGNPSCTITATLGANGTATYPAGQSCNLVNPVSATLTTTDGSVATLQPGKLTTKQNVVVSNSPGFDGQTGTLVSNCTRP